MYVAQPRTTKSGTCYQQIRISCSNLEHFGIEMPTLVKAGKQDLQRLVDAISQ